MIDRKRKSQCRKQAGSYSIFVGMVSLVVMFLGTPVYSDTIDLPKTGQTVCYDNDGDPITCLGTGQDGDLLAGVAWPVPRFEVDSNLACVTDNLTGLMWSRNAYTPSVTWATWSNSVSYAAGFTNLCGYGDWRLPNVNELTSLVNAEQPDTALWLETYGFRFRTDINPIYWSSTSSANLPLINAWNVSMIDGSVIAESKDTTYLIWPVRGTSNPSTNPPPGQIPETGQTESYASYDDAYFAITPGLNVGVPWPAPRFTDSTDCVTDNLTGLMWSKDGNLDGLKTWVNALSFTEDLTICGYVDWRLPNSKELLSLIDRSRSEPALPAANPFTNVRSGASDTYWSSTSYAFNPTEAWTVDMLLGNLTPLIKTETAFVWPVRGGETRPYRLTVRKEGDGKGKVSASGLSCGGNKCTGDYSSYEIVTVTATAQTGSVFTGWDGDPCTGVVDSTCIITMTADTNITATFLPEYKISVSPKSLNFKNLKRDVASQPLSVTITNVGVADLRISLPVIGGDFPSVFTVTDNSCPAALSSNETCAMTLTATSPDYDQKTAELQILSNDPKNPTTTVKLKAKAKPPKIGKKPSSLNFKKVTVGVPTNLTLALTNKGVTDLEIPYTGTITISGDHQGDFSSTPNTCPALANDGSSCTLTVTFTPAALGKRSAVLNIPSNDPKKPVLTVNLKGTGE